VVFEHKALAEFWKRYGALSQEAQRQADKQFALLFENPMHPSLHLKPVGEFWSARVTDACRALAVREGNVFTWFWIGSHDEYERLLNG
jgi:hypothetical protein